MFNIYHILFNINHIKGNNNFQCRSKSYNTSNDINDIEIITIKLFREFVIGPGRLRPVKSVYECSARI
jgi:hypothetical protein